MRTDEHPAPVLPWHRETADDMRERDAISYEDVVFVSTIIAEHDPHATTVRLLEQAAKLAESSDDQWGPEHKERLDEIRAYLAALQPEGAAK